MRKGTVRSWGRGTWIGTALVVGCACGLVVVAIAVAAAPLKGRAYVGQGQQGPAYFQVSADGTTLSDFHVGNFDLPCNGASGIRLPTTGKIANGKFTITWARGSLRATFKGQFLSNGKASGTSFYQVVGGCHHTYTWSVTALPANTHLCAQHVGPSNSGSEAVEAEIIATSVTCTAVYRALDAGKFREDLQNSSTDTGVGVFSTVGWTCAETSRDYYRCSRSSPAAKFTFHQTGQPCGYPSPSPPGPQCQVTAAQEVPGTAKLNAGGSAAVSALSCASAGNCAAGGSYMDGSGFTQAFVAKEVNGTWGNAEEIPGTATLNAGGTAQLNSLSCRSAGNCSAGGSYTDGSGYQQAFVVDEVNGTWGSAEEVPGTAALNVYGVAAVSSVSCGSAGNCAAGGYYLGGSGEQAFVVDEVNGTWGSEEAVPGLSTTLGATSSHLYTLSCASAGNCAAGGSYIDGSGHTQAFVVDETAGTWGSAEEVPGTGALNSHGYAVLGSVSCPSAGNCAAGGYYTDGSGGQAFVVDEASGTWGDAEEAPGSAMLNAGGNAAVNALSCASAGNCAAGGSYVDGSAHTQALVAQDVNATWGGAEEAPGTGTLNAGGNAVVSSVSCTSGGGCSAGGYYTDGSSDREPFVVNRANGTWGSAKGIPGLGTLNNGSAEVDALSCVSASSCVAGGSYTDVYNHQQAFVVGYTS